MTSAWPSDQQATDGQAHHPDLKLVAEPMVLYAGALLAGIGIYFVLPVQPNWWHVLAPLFCAFVLWWLNRSGALGHAFGLLVWLVVGVIVAHVHTMRMNTPLLYAGQMPWVTVQGTIKSIDYREDGERLIVQNLKVLEGARMRWLDGSGLQLKPQHQREAFSVGQRVQGRVQLFPIGPPPVPGSLDLQFRAYFDGVSAYGATRGPLTVLDDTSASDMRTYVEALRQRIRANIVQKLGEERGSVLVAMTVGFPRGVPEEKREALRRAGLAHLLAISGLHMTLVVSGVFWLIRTVLAIAQIHRRAELWRLPIKKVAMLAALGVGLGYFFLSGQAVPAQRAFLMASLFAMAILLDRHGVSLRMLGIAALVVMIVAPQVVLGPSFQMSFAAVTLLIFVGRLFPRRRLVGLGWQIPNYLLGVGFASVLATVATAILTLFHFGQVSLVSVFANLIAVPIAAFVVMPSALLAILLMPFGFDGPVLMLAGLGLDGIQAVASAAAATPISVIEVASWPRAVPPLFAAVMILMVGLRGWWRGTAIVPLILMVTLIIIHRPADLIITPEGGLAVRVQEDYAVVGPGVDTFQQAFLSEYWQTGVFVETIDKVLGHGIGVRQDSDCTTQGCVLAEHTAITLTTEAVSQACHDQLIQISTVFVPLACRMTGGFTSADVLDDGPLAIWVKGLPASSVIIQSDRDRRGSRPWVGARYAGQ